MVPNEVVEAFAVEGVADQLLEVVPTDSMAEGPRAVDVVEELTSVGVLEDDVALPQILPS